MGVQTYFNSIISSHHIPQQFVTEMKYPITFMSAGFQCFSSLLLSLLLLLLFQHSFSVSIRISPADFEHIYYDTNTN